jgi:hypothetical protein
MSLSSPIVLFSLEGCNGSPETLNYRVFGFYLVSLSPQALSCRLTWRWRGSLQVLKRAEFVIICGGL